MMKDSKAFIPIAFNDEIIFHQQFFFRGAYSFRFEI